VIKRSLILLLALAALLLPACGDKHDTPEATISMMRESVEQGRADKLTRFIYAENQDMRRLLNRTGRLLGNLQKLGVAVNNKFPEDVKKLREQAEAAAKSGKSSSFLSQALAGQRRRGSVSIGARTPAAPSSPNQLRDSFDASMKQLFADPYAWIEQSEQRLSTEFLTDDSVAVLWDGKPALAPLGLVMKRDLRDGQWYFVLPTNIPGLSRIFPKTQKEFEIWGGLISVFDNMIIDLTKEVEAGRVASIDDLSRKAGEMAFMPAMITVFAYSRLSEVQREEAKAAKAAEAAPQGK
jgi:hypothetical protein